MKRLLLMACSVALFNLAQAQSANVAAAGTAAPAISKEERAKMMEKDLAESFTKAGLTEDQTKKVKEAIDAVSAKGMEIRNNESLTREQKMEESKKLMKERDDAIKAAIGEEKFKEWSAIRMQQREKYAQPKGN